MANQAVLMVTQKNQVIKKKIPIASEWLFNEQIMRAWLTLRKYFVRCQAFGKGRGLVIDERYAKPLSPYPLYDDAELEGLTDLQARLKQAKNWFTFQANRQQRINIIAYATTTIVCGMVIIFILFAILIMSGVISV